MFVWWLTTLFIGISCMPLCAYVFRRFEDRGWLFSKSVGLMISGWIMLVLSEMHIVKFLNGGCIAIIMVVLAVNYVLLFRHRKAGIFKGINWRLVIAEEVAFALIFAVWCWIIMCKPEAYGTEKFMDYGYMTSLMRTLYLPPVDTWYAGEAINYYYGGQYLATFLVKTSGVTVAVGYNLMRATIASFSCMLPFAVVYQLLKDRLKNKPRVATVAAAVGGSLAGFAAAFCSNAHYIVYNLIGRIVAYAKGTEFSYWFPDATRYIGYNPDLPDKTIHEFPAYSTVLGDLHAHYINLIFVFVAVAFAIAYAQRMAAEMEDAVTGATPAVSRTNKKKAKQAVKEVPGALVPDEFGGCAGGLMEAYTNLGGVQRGIDPEETQLKGAALIWHKAKHYLKAIFCPELILIGFFTGMFKFTNFWDFPIYFVVCGALVLFTNLRRYKGKPVEFLIVMGGQAVAAFVIGTLAALPFTIFFDQISSQIKTTHSHSLFYQLMVLWGLPLLILIGFVVLMLRERYLGKKAHAATVAAAAEDAARREAKKKAKEAKKAAAEGADAAVAAEAVPEENAADAEPPKKKGKLAAFFAGKAGWVWRMELPDMLALLLGLCAAGLVLLPEIIYVVDIYSGDYYRGNTMFKLTYQAFVLFAMLMGYVLLRTIALSEKAPRIIACVLTACLCLTGGYIFTSINSWFGNVFDLSRHVSLSCDYYLNTEFKEDQAAISWINGNIFEQAVMVEANGDSYTGYERVSVSTGLPTIMGWYVHEWLWRSGAKSTGATSSDTTEDVNAKTTAMLNERVQDVQKIYESNDEAAFQSVVDKYGVKYVYVGSKEREKFANINEEFLRSMGTVVYEDDYVFIVQVSSSTGTSETATPTA